MIEVYIKLTNKKEKEKEKKRNYKVPVGTRS